MRSLLDNKKAKIVILLSILAIVSFCVYGVYQAYFTQKEQITIFGKTIGGIDFELSTADRLKNADENIININLNNKKMGIDILPTIIITSETVIPEDQYNISCTLEGQDVIKDIIYSEDRKTIFITLQYREVEKNTELDYVFGLMNNSEIDEERYSDLIFDFSVDARNKKWYTTKNIELIRDNTVIINDVEVSSENATENATDKQTVILEEGE